MQTINIRFYSIYIYIYIERERERERDETRRDEARRERAVTTKDSLLAWEVMTHIIFIL